MKRTRDGNEESDLIHVPGTLSCVRSVFLQGTLVRDVIAKWVDNLETLWWLYQTCSNTLRVLGDLPDIVLYREARTYKHGQLCHAVTTRFEARQPVPTRCLTHLMTDARQFISYELLVAGGGASLEFVRLFVVHRHSITLDPVCMMGGTYDEYSSLESQIVEGAVNSGSWGWLQMVLTIVQPSPFLFDEAMTDAFFGGMHKEVYAHVGVVPNANFMRNALTASKGTECIEFICETWPGIARGQAGTLESSMFWPCKLQPLVYYISWLRHHHSIAIDYEALFVARMAHDTVPRSRTDNPEILDWLRPLALALFSARRRVQADALPIFLSGERLTIYGQGVRGAHGLNVFPGLRDSDHYAYWHPENLLVATGILSEGNAYAGLDGTAIPKYVRRPK